MTRIGKVTVWGLEARQAGLIVSRLVVENGKIVLGRWMSSGFVTNGIDEGVVFERSPIANRARLT
jgi:hypothetical protein